MAWVTVKDDLEALTEYLCDYPDCPNEATRLIAQSMGMTYAVCAEHVRFWEER